MLFCIIHLVPQAVLPYEKRTYRINLGGKGIQIYKEIDSLGFKGAHAATVLLRWIDMVDPDSIRSQIFHRFCIACALGDVEERVEGGKLISHAWYITLANARWSYSCCKAHP